MFTNKRTIALAALLTAFSSAGIGQVNFTGSYTQDFDSLISAPTAANTSANPWANNSTLPGWYLFNSLGTAITTYVGGNGSTNAGSAYSYGTVASTERAFGSVASGGAYFGSPVSGALAAHIAFSATNTSGGDYASFTFAYDSEQWRNGGNASAQSYVAEYGFGGTFATVGAWTPAGTSFNLVTTIATASAAAVDGNSAGLTASRGGSITSTWANGTTLWIRFIEMNDVGNDHALAVDNFSLTAIPEPAAFATLAGVAALAGVALLRRRRAIVR